jgi:peptidoglycan/xylan/chitin deacetylase (PgdA/CDA1 family)
MNTIGLDAFVGARHAGCGSIVVLHSVVERRADYLFDNLRASADYLDRLIRHFAASGIEAVSLDEALHRLFRREGGRFVHFTLDDGFKDNLTVALPIFERHRVPFTVFVTTCFVERTLDNWWTGLAELLKRSESVDVPEISQRFPCAGLSEKVAAYRSLLAAVNRGQLSPTAVGYLLKRHGISLADVLDRDALSVAELRQLAAHPLVEIGGHTTSHLPLRTLPADEALREMVDNKTWLERLLGTEVRHFAYPYGTAAACREREAQLARQAGFLSASTTRNGNLFTAHSDNTWALPRLRPFSELESTKLVDFQRRGGAGALLRMFKDPIVTM